MKISKVIRTKTPIHGVKMYAAVESELGLHVYSVVYVRTKRVRQWLCNCPTFLFRQFSLHRNCKHIRAVRERYGRFGTRVPLT